MLEAVLVAATAFALDAKGVLEAAVAFQTAAVRKEDGDLKTTLYLSLLLPLRQFLRL